MNTVEKVLRWIVIGGVFALPFIPAIVADPLFFPYITGKNFAFRVIVEIIAGCFLALAVMDPKYRPRRSWILGCFAIFVLVMAIADAQGVMPFKSFWSNYERMDGWVTIAHLLLYIVVVASVVRTEQLWRRLLQWTVWVSLYLSVLGLLQEASIVNFGGGSGTTGLTGRIDTTFGNPIYLAVYMLFNVFIAAMLWYQEGKERWSTQERIWYAVGILGCYVLVASQLSGSAAGILLLCTLVFFALMEGVMYLPRTWVLGAAIVLDTVALLFTATRGATLGLIGGAFLALLLYAFSSSGSKRLRQWVVGVFVLLIVLSGALYAARNSSFIQHVDILNRFATISLSDGDTVARIINIEIAWKGVEERPILGWGQENYAIVFDKFYDPRMYAQEQWFDRVHDIIFDWWIAGGTLGLLAYLSIFVLTLWAVWRKGVFSAAERAILTGLIAGYFVQNLTVFDNITSYILFGTILGYIVWRETDARKIPPISSKALLPRSMWPYVAAVGIAIALCAAWWVNAAALMENLTLIAALEPQSAGVQQNLALFEQAISYGTYGTQEAREQFAQQADSLATAASSSIPDDLKNQYLNDSVQQLNDQAALSPLDARFPLFAGVTLDAFGDYSGALPYLEKALSLSPDKQTILYELAGNEQALGDTTSELQYFAQAYNLDTQDLDARMYYASALIEAGQDTQAQALLEPLSATVQADSRIAQAYASVNDYAAIIPIWKAAVAADPTNAQNYLTLAAAYYAQGEEAQSIAILQQGEAAVPSMQAQAQQLIAEIQSGTVSSGGQ